MAACIMHHDSIMDNTFFCLSTDMTWPPPHFKNCIGNSTKSFFYFLVRASAAREREREREETSMLQGSPACCTITARPDDTDKST